MRDAIVVSSQTWSHFGTLERISICLAMAGAGVLYCEKPYTLLERRTRTNFKSHLDISVHRPTIISRKHYRYSVGSRFQAAMFARQIVRRARKLNLKRPVVIYPHGVHYPPLARELKRRGFDLVYFCGDYEVAGIFEHARIADLTLVLSHAAYLDLKKEVGEKICKLAETGPVPASLVPRTALGAASATAWPEIPSPRLIYFGNIETRVDLGLLETFLRANPKWNFVSFAQKPAQPMPNHFVLPWGSPEQLTQLLAPGSIGFQPYECHTTKTLHCVPLKMFDYFAHGIPVVSTPITFLQECGDLIYAGSTVEELSAAVQMALAEPPDSPKRAERMNFAEKNGNTIEQVSQFLAPLLAESEIFPPLAWEKGTRALPSTSSCQARMRSDLTPEVKI